MYKKGSYIFCSYRFPINTWFICTRYICNFRFCLIHLIKELCIVMRIQVLYTADLKFYAKAVLLTSIIAVSPFPVSQWFLKNSSPYTVTVSLRILTGFSFAHQVRCNLCVITLHIFNSDILFLSHFHKNVNTIRVYFPLMFGIMLLFTPFTVT